MTNKKLTLLAFGHRDYYIPLPFKAGSIKTQTLLQDNYRKTLIKQLKIKGAWELWQFA